MVNIVIDALHTMLGNKLQIHGKNYQEKLRKQINF